ncbi:MAG: VWA domain-containing protein [Deltaproteobacteria bacterium]|jgi:magnesium chelatase subunit D|nr:VWA domain-containing protein [Deltaproteobacteria bacterium]
MLRRAAAETLLLADGSPRLPLRLDRGRWLRRERHRRPGRLVVLLVDISGSMGGKQMDLARRVALAVLRKAYVARDRVAMIAFRESAARLLFGPTNQVERLHQSLRSLPLGGTTPLAAGLARARETLRRAAARDRHEKQRLVLISDGRANVGSRPGHGAVVAEVEAAALALARLSRLAIDFLDTTEPGKDDRLARWLAVQLGARRVRLAELTPAGAAAALVPWG